MFKNYFEIIVDEVMPDVLKGVDNICKCEKCIDEMKCIALNNLSPMYCNVRDGEIYLLYNNLHTQYKADVTTQLTKAMLIVAGRPKHD